MQIEIFKPFGEAFELTKKILFQPFDLRKWCVVGFAAFLSHLGSGGFNFNYNSRSDLKETPGFQDLVAWIKQIPPWILVSAVSVLVVLVLAIMVVLAWLRARGRFIFIDCIVTNRGAIAEPWREFRKDGKSYFVFSLLVGCGFAVVAMLLALPFFLPIIRGVTFLHLHDAYLISMMILWGAVIVLFALTWVLIGQFMVVLMYRRRCRASEAFRAAVSLIARYPGEITLYCLFWIALGLGSVVVACASICATCCIALIPYIGTVMLLPMYVCLRAFSLLFLRQFGSDYDVWATLPQLEAPPPLPA
jgi:hypothetical protein